jgi:putative endonuclease
MIVERNYRKKWGEIDIIAQKTGVVHFVEVKTVSDIGINENDIDSYQPEDNVHPRKLKRLARAVSTYLANSKQDTEWQFDIAAVFLDRANKRARVRYLEDIVL